MTSAKFDLGRLLSTPGALEVLRKAGQAPADFIARHAAGDWGEVGPEDSELNNAALVAGERLLSSYRTRLGVKLWIITEAVGDDGKRAATTILLPEEY